MPIFKTCTFAHISALRCTPENPKNEKIQSQGTAAKRRPNHAIGGMRFVQ